MENKKLFSFGFGKDLFKEKRFVFAGPGAGGPAEAASERPEEREKALKLIALIAKDNPQILENKTPKDLMENNPYLTGLYAKLNTFTEDDWKIANTVVENGVVKLTRTDGAKFSIDGDAYMALNWLKITKGLNETVFAGRDFFQKFYFEVLRVANAPKLAAIIDKLGNNTPVGSNDPLVADAVEEVKKSPSYIEKEALKAGASLRGARGREQARASVEREQVGNEAMVGDALGLTDADTDKERIDIWRGNILRERNKIDAAHWQPQTQEGLDRMKEEWALVIGDRVNSSIGFYAKLFAVLQEPLTVNYRNKLDSKMQAAYLNPGVDSNLELIKGHNPSYYNAWKFYKSLQDAFKNLDTHQGNTVKERAELNKEPVSNAIFDGAKANLKSFGDAIKNRDYATAAVYVAGIWALYKAYGQLAEGNDGAKKWIIYGLAAYTGNIFLKNAGFDVLKKLGIKDIDAEVKGTSLEGLMRLNIPQAKDVDSVVYLRSGHVPITTLHKKYLETHVRADDKHEGFIDPAQFPAEFPEFAGRTPEDKKKDKEYARVGHELYKLAQVLEIGYNRTLKVDKGLKGTDTYYGKSYEEAMKMPVIRDSNVEQFVAILSEYQPLTDTVSIITPEAVKKVRERMSLAFKDRGLGESFDIQEIDENKHILGGKIKGLPVVVRTNTTGKTYEIFAKKDYKEQGDSLHISNALGRIPFEGETKNSVDDMEAAIDRKMKSYIDPIVSGGNQMTSKPVFRDGKWTFGMKTVGAAKFGIAAGETTAEINVDEKGFVSVEMKGIGVNINVDYFVDKETPYAGVLLARMVSGKELAGLKPLMNAGKIDFLSDKNLPDRNGHPTFKIRVAGRELVVEYDKAADKFIIDPADQEKLMKDPAFADQYINALDKDSRFEFNQTVEDWRKLIKHACPEGFVGFFFSSITGNTDRGSLRGINTDVLSGSIPDNFTNMILDTTRVELTERFRRNLAGVTNLEDVEKARMEAFEVTNAKMKQLYDDVSAKNKLMLDRGEKWNRAEFMTQVIDPLRSSSSKSSIYSLQRADLEYTLYQLNLPGIATASDFNDIAHKSVGKLMGVYSYYTANLDNHEFGAQKIDLDHLTYPPSATSGIADNTKDPALRGHYVLNYLEYVKMRIANESQIISGGKALKPSLIHAPGSPAWKIEEFDVWQKTHSYLPLDALDSQNALDHKKVDHDAGNHTDLDKELISELNKAKDFLVSKFDVNIAEIDNYLNGPTKDSSGNKKLYHEWGLTTIGHKSTTTGMLYRSRLWDQTDRIATIAGNRRSIQQKLIQQQVDDFLDRAFREPLVSKFFHQKPSLLEEGKIMYRKWKYGI